MSWLLLLLWGGLSILMLITLDILSFNLRRTGFARFLSTFLLFIVQVITTEFILGLFSWLTIPGLVLINLAISGALLFALIKHYDKA